LTVRIDNFPNIKNVENLGGKKNQTHIIFEFHVEENINKSKQDLLKFIFFSIIIQLFY